MAVIDERSPLDAEDRWPWPPAPRSLCDQLAPGTAVVFVLLAFGAWRVPLPRVPDGSISRGACRILYCRNLLTDSRTLLPSSAGPLTDLRSKASRRAGERRIARSDQIENPGPNALSIVAPRRSGSAVLG